jgi:hypothetical protein
VRSSFGRRLALSEQREPARLTRFAEKLPTYAWRVTHLRMVERSHEPYTRRRPMPWIVLFQIPLPRAVPAWPCAVPALFATREPPAESCWLASVFHRRLEAASVPTSGQPFGFLSSSRARPFSA